MHRTMFIAIVYAAATFAVFGVHPTPVFAATHVENNVSVHAQSGNTVIQNGAVVHEGSAQASVDIVSTVNGERVVDVHETSTDGPIEYHAVTTTDEQGRTTTTVTSNTPEPSTTEPTAEPHTEAVPDDTRPSAPADDTATANAQRQAVEVAIAELRGSIITLIEAYDRERYVPNENEHHDGSLLGRIMGTVTHTMYHVISTLF